MSPPLLDVAKARSQFPSLDSGYIFADNAGGSQCTKQVIDRITDYFINSNVQLSADYSISIKSTNRVLSEAPTSIAQLFNARSPDEIVFGSSSTMNMENLARGLENDIQPGDELIITGEHEGKTIILRP
jgi:selenocysteine lyase/cysteine desulfurase